jgi:hypothetical protein
LASSSAPGVQSDATEDLQHRSSVPCTISA